MAEISNISTPVINSYETLFEEELDDTFKIEDVFSLEATTSELYFVKEEPLSEGEESKPVWLGDLSAVNFKIKPRKVKKCKKCSTVFTNRWSFNAHIKFCRNRFQCLECGKRFWKSCFLKYHKQRTHSCISKNGLRHCQDCEIVFRWKHQLLFHVVQHSSVSCPFCASEYQSVETLKRHYLESHC